MLVLAQYCSLCSVVRQWKIIHLGRPWAQIRLYMRNLTTGGWRSLRGPSRPPLDRGALNGLIRLGNDPALVCIVKLDSTCINQSGSEYYSLKYQQNCISCSRQNSPKPVFGCEWSVLDLRLGIRYWWCLTSIDQYSKCLNNRPLPNMEGVCSTLHSDI